MSLKRINTISEINTADITFQNFRWKYGTGVETSTGKGANKKVSYRNGVMTDLGDIELNCPYCGCWSEYAILESDMIIG